MVEIVKAGGWLMAPIVLCAIIAMGIILERYWTLAEKRVIPEDLTSKVWAWVKRDALDQSQIQTLHQGSPLGQILAAGLINRDRERAGCGGRPARTPRARSRRRGAGPAAQSAKSDPKGPRKAISIGILHLYLTNREWQRARALRALCVVGASTEDRDHRLCEENGRVL